jgi:hypothetical protein
MGNAARVLMVAVALAIAGAWFLGRQRGEERRVEQPPVTLAPDNTPPPAPASPLAPPAAGEVGAKVRQLFGAVAVFAGGPFAAGDFNGDGWYDLAVVVRPAAAHLDRLNADAGNWIVHDPMAAAAASPGAMPARPNVTAEPVLVIVHGFDAAGWRSADARQAYVLTGVAGPRLDARPVAELAAEAGVQLRPDLGTDAIVEEVRGRRGFVFWAGARYSWQPLRAPASSL